MKTTDFTLQVEGMSCASCVSKIESALGKVEGVERVSVNLATKSASVKISNGQVHLEKMVDAVADVGYAIPVKQMMLPIGGMTCASCVSKI